jgi:pimeloyl-ACP methyl ester carboxylesterase
LAAFDDLSGYCVMTDLSDPALDAEAKALLEEAAKPKRRVRPRLARRLADAQDLEVHTPNGPVMAWRLGDGPASLLVHGWEDDNALWSPLIDACADIFRAVVVLDLPGHGFSPAETHSVESAGEAVVAVAKALGPIDSIVGHSFGCPASIYALSHGLSVNRAVMIASPMPRTKGRGEEDWSRRWKGRLLERGADPEVVDRAAEIMAAEWEGSAGGHALVEAKIAEMTAKALIMHSVDDEQCPVGNSREMADRWPGSELLLLDGLGHRLIAQDPEVIQRTIAFVEDFG